jgi:hypothetical protein
VKTPGICAFVLKGDEALAKAIRREICAEVNGDSQEASVAWSQFSSNPSAHNRWVDTIPMITGNINDKAYFLLNKTLGLHDQDVVFVGVNPTIFTVLLYMIVIDDRAVQLC